MHAAMPAISPLPPCCHHYGLPNTPAPPGCDARSRWHPACSPASGSLALGAARTFCLVTFSAPPPGTRRFLGGGNAGRQERRGLLGTLGLVPWQAPPLRNAIELFGGMKRLPVQPLGSPVPFSPPCCQWGQSIQLSWGYRGCFTLLYNGVAFDVLFLYVSFWLAPLRRRLSRLPANAVAWHRKGEGREERGERR